MLANGRIAFWFELSLTFCFAISIWLRSVGSVKLKTSLDSCIALLFACSFEENKTYKRGLHSCKSVNAVAAT